MLHSNAKKTMEQKRISAFKPQELCSLSFKQLCSMRTVPISQDCISIPCTTKQGHSLTFLPTSQNPKYRTDSRANPKSGPNDKTIDQEVGKSNTLQLPTGNHIPLGLAAVPNSKPRAHAEGQLHSMFIYLFIYFLSSTTIYVGSKYITFFFLQVEGWAKVQAQTNFLTPYSGGQPNSQIAK